jgi:glyoxylase-like metal-dependent hydrolase (beta-lactamase superfamily II)
MSASGRDANSSGRTDPNLSDPVRSVKVLTTGTVEIHPQQVVGSRLPEYVWIAGSRRWLPPRPVNAYLIEHARGVVLFDTGQDRASVTDPSYFPGGITGWLYRRLARFQIGPADTLTAKLAETGHDPSEVDLAILSHLHEDHIGGIGELPNAEFLVSEVEWRSIFRPMPELRGLLRRHIDRPGFRVNGVQFEPTGEPALAPVGRAHDIMGDGSLVLLPTPGHTAGSISLLVRRRVGPPILLVGDLTYELELLEAGHVPGVGERRSLRSSSAAVRALQDRLPGLAILPAHDPGAAERLRAATTQRFADMTATEPSGAPLGRAS